MSVGHVQMQQSAPATPGTSNIDSATPRPIHGMILDMLRALLPQGRDARIAFSIRPGGWDAFTEGYARRQRQTGAQTPATGGHCGGVNPSSARNSAAVISRPSSSL